MSYIHSSARESYRHWWEQQTRWVWWYEDHQSLFGYRQEIKVLYPHLFPQKPRRRRYTRHTYTRRLPAWDISTSGESRFVQSGYAKKEISNVEQSRRDWRERKGFRRDKAKGRCWCKCNLNDAKRGRRAWERDKIRKGQYEDLDQYDKNMFTDGWDCC